MIRTLFAGACAVMLFGCNMTPEEGHCEKTKAPSISVNFNVTAYNVETNDNSASYDLQSYKHYCDGTIKGQFDINGLIDNSGTFRSTMRVGYNFHNKEDKAVFTYWFNGVGSGTRSVYYDEVAGYAGGTYNLEINTPSDELASLKQQYNENPENFRQCQDLPWVLVTGNQDPDGMADKTQLYSELKSAGYVDIEQDVVPEGNSTVPVIDFEDGDIVMLSFNNPPGTESNPKADHYAVVYGGKLYQILNWTSMGEFDGPRDFSFFFNPRTLTNPVSGETVVSNREYQFYKVWRKASL
jgi:hypothetical protein